MSKSIPIRKRILVANREKSYDINIGIIKNNFEARYNDDKLNSNNTLNTTVSASLIVCNKDQIKEEKKVKKKNPKKLKVTFTDKIDIVHIDNYKSYNKISPSFIIFETIQDMSMTCGSGSCIII
jgi:hypothetical protein